jgi:hypothetical protein
MDVIEQWIADWIGIRATLKSQLKHFESGRGGVSPRGGGGLTDEAEARIHRCVGEIELLIAHYSSKS